jgi:hypothetical protein
MINRAPQVHMPAGDPDDHFVEIPAITWSRTAPSQSPGDRRSEFACQFASNRDPVFAANRDPSEVLGFGLPL